MSRRIVVGVDFSATAHAALEQALFMARSSNAGLDVVHVIDVFGDNPLVEVLRSAVNDESVERTLVEESDRLMREFVGDIDFGETRPRFIHTRAPNVAAALTKYVEEQRAELLAVGSHGRRGLKRVLVGSVTVRLIQSAAVPLLIVKLSKAESIRDPIDRLLVCVDLSDISMTTLEAAHRLAQEYHSHMDIVHVVEPYSIPVSLTGIKTISEIVPTILSDIEKELVALVARLEGTYVPYRVHVLEGGAAESIVGASSEFNSDLIVMAKRHASRLERVAFGSTIEKVSRDTNVPLYVVPVAREESLGPDRSSARRAET